MKEFELKCKLTNGKTLKCKGSKKSLNAIVAKLNSSSICFVDIEGNGENINKALIGSYTVGEAVEPKPEKVPLNEVKKSTKKAAPPETRSNETSGYPY